jgi:hypothetical protein
VSQAARPLDAAASLAARLPVGADRCVVARLDDAELSAPAPVVGAPSRRGLLRRVMQADALAWDEELKVVAIASADAARDDGPGAQVLLLRSALAPELLRERLSARLNIDWTGAACSAAPCPLKGKQGSDGVVALARAQWPAGGAPGAEVRCRDIGASENASAVELQASRVRRIPLVEAHGVPLRTTTVARVDRDGVRTERAELMASRDAAAERVEQLRAEAQRAARDASDLQVEQEDALVRTYLHFAWSALELRVDDEARLVAAEHAARARAAMPAPELAPGLPPSAYLARAAHLMLGMHDQRASERAAQRASLSALLEQAVSEHPEHEPLAALLFDLQLSEAASAPAALALAERFAALVGADPRWAERVRAAREVLAKAKP